MEFKKKEFIEKIIKKQSWADIFDKGDFLLNQIVVHQLAKKNILIRDSKPLYEYLNKNSIFESVMLNYIAKNPQDLTLIIYREPLTNKLFFFDLGKTEQIEEQVRTDARVNALHMGNYYKTSIQLPKGKLLTIAVSEKFGYLDHKFRQYITDKEHYNLLKIKAVQAVFKYDDEEDIDEIGDALADLLPLLQEIEGQNNTEEG